MVELCRILFKCIKIEKSIALLKVIRLKMKSNFLFNPSNKLKCLRIVIFFEKNRFKSVTFAKKDP
jgi:hypothetical protein